MDSRVTLCTWGPPPPYKQGLTHQLWITILIPCWMGFWLKEEANVLSTMVTTPLSLPSLAISSRSTKVMVGLQGVSQKIT